MNYIELEDEQTLKDWLQEYEKPENQDKYILPNCMYGYESIRRELLRRDRIRGIMEDFNNE